MLKKIGLGSLFLFMLLLFTLGTKATRAQTDFDCTAITDGMPQIECEALVAIYNANNGANYYGGASSGDDWLETNTPCSWFDVTCESGVLTSLDLRFVY